MPNSLVSIVVPIYKVEQYLERCLDSIIAQRYRPIEVILVNDGSPDGCGDIIKRYEARYPIFRSIWQEHQGVGAAPSIYYEDVATTSRVLELAKRVAITHKPIYHYCLRRSGITGNFHVKNIEDYLKAVDIIRHFIWNENLWDAWYKPYREFLRKTEILLLIETLSRKQLSTKVRKYQLIQEIRTRIKELECPPST